MNTDPQSYILSEAESRLIFEQTILPTELGALSPATHNPNTNTTTTKPPLAVLIIGQTGAGKTRTAPLLKQTLQHLRSSPPIHFIADTYKTYHPSYASLLQTHPPLASPATSPDARRWLLHAATVAATRRSDVLLESATRHPDDFAALAQLFHGHGYRVEVVVLAVPAALSRLGILRRYYEGLPEAGPGWGLPVRLTPRGVHDEAYKGVVEAAGFVDGDGGEGGVDQVLVLRRGNVVAYVDECVDGVWRRGEGVVQVLRRERERPLTETERVGARESLCRLREMDVPGLEGQLLEIEELLKPLLGDSDDGGYPPLRPLSLPTSSHDEEFDVEAGLRLGMV
ncbi:zeta toxin-domain-containing protein [Annulohypoxylon maeteangense]|uniref:zeta toxin-domain-containing protein n=1 Tax=Annulohypoxylon maeteangense TaxID=1927788 RepID=UPI002007AB04|nr:zeta toxin-domain-containing protein [Annulohypoxylon maeteangense]KAI0887491.1 zeta toxin-domain-containing protein [Annulohypoxylon maeteangense]